MSLPDQATDAWLVPAGSENNALTELAGLDGGTVTPVGGEISVNTTTLYIQQYPQITTLANGGFVITWDDASSYPGDIRAQVFMADGTALGEEILVNTTTLNDQFIPQITALSSGGFVIAWNDQSNDSGDIRAQVFTDHGSVLGEEILVNTTTSGWQWDQQITALAEGGFVVIWEDQSSDVGDIRAQVFTADGMTIGEEVLVNSTTLNDQSDPQVTALADGGFVVTWEDESSNAGDIRAQVFTADGTALGGDFAVNSTTRGVQGDPQITALADGGFVITWQDYNGIGGDGASTDVRAQVFAANGIPQGEEVLVNSTTLSTQNSPKIAALTEGGFVITWQDDSSDAGDIRAQVFASDGTALGTEITVNTITHHDQSDPRISALAGGGFVITWFSDYQDNPRELRAQVFARDGTPIGDEFGVNTENRGLQIDPKITALSDGGFVVTWVDWSPADGSDSGIKAQVFEVTDGGVNAVPEATGSDATLAAGESIALADLFDWSDADGADDIVAFAVQDRDVGGGYLTLNGERVDEGVVYDDIPIGEIGNWAFVAGPAGSSDTVGFNVIDAQGAFNLPSATAVVSSTDPTAAPGLVEAAVFASLAYSDNPTAPDGWILLSGDSLGLTGTDWDDDASDTTNNMFVYDMGPAQAIVATNGSTLVLAFRGTEELGDFLADLVGGLASFAPHYQLFAGLIDAIDAYVGEAANGITDVMVAGHSLGGVMVEWFMSGHPDFGGISYSGYAFGSPGDRYIAAGPDDRLWNIGHSGDPIHQIASGTGQGMGIVIDLPASPDWTLLDLVENAVFGYMGEHGSALYQVSAQLMTHSEILYPRYLETPGYYDVTIADFGTARGSAAQDYLIGGLNQSRLFGGDGGDLIYGFAGDDTLLGEAGDDWLDGGTGNDTLLGGNGNDNLFGGNDNDSVVGGAGDDTLNGGLANDTLIGNHGIDIMTGGEGADIFAFIMGGDIIRITDFEAGVDDLAFVGLPTGFTASDLLPFVSQVGNDVIIAAGGQQVVFEDTLLSDLGGGDVIFV